MSGDRTRRWTPRVRLRRDRLTGQIAFALVGVLAVSAIVYGVGTASARYHLSDVGSWLTATAKGMVVHANGLAGKVDGRANMIPQMRGHHVKVVQDGTTVLLVDTDTGVVSRIDPSQLTVQTSRDLGASGVQVIVGGNAAYSVDAVKGSVQRIDPVTLAGIGQALSLPWPLGQAGIDASGTLWVPAPKTGQLFPVRAGQQGTPVQVGRPGDALGLTIAAGAPVVTDSTSATALVVRADGTQSVRLPGGATRAEGGLKTPPVADGQTVPMLGDGGSLYLLDSGTGRVASVALRVSGHEYEPPNILGPRVYLPDRTAGRLMVYNTESNAWERSVQAARPGTPFDVAVRDHMLWVNDPEGATAYAFDPNGSQKAIKKYDDKVPGGHRRPIPKPAPGGNGDGNNNGGGQGGGQGGDHPAPPGRRPPHKPAPPGAPTPPSNLGVQALSDGVKLTFARSQGNNVLGYVVKGANGFKVSPKTLPANASSPAFTLKGGNCAQQYTFTVAVLYKDAKNKKAELESDPSDPVRPCLAPAQVPVNTSVVDHGANLSWTSSTARGVTYELSVDGGAPATVTSPHTVGGLANDQVHSFTLTVRNGAGSSDTAGSIDLSYRVKSYRNANNDQTDTLIRVSPNGAKSGKYIPKGWYGSIDVVCQVQGPKYHDTQSNTDSTVWDHIRAPQGEGYINDTLMATPKGAMPVDGLLSCQ